MPTHRGTWSGRSCSRDPTRGWGETSVERTDRFGRGLVSLLAEWGRKGRWVAAPGLSSDYCPLSRRGFVLEVDGRVLAAAAQHLTGTALLHHGTLPRTLDRTRIARWFDLASPGPVDRLTALNELGITDPADRVAARLAHHLALGLSAPAA